MEIRPNIKIAQDIELWEGCRIICLPMCCQNILCTMMIIMDTALAEILQAFENRIPV